MGCFPGRKDGHGFAQRVGLVIPLTQGRKLRLSWGRFGRGGRQSVHDARKITFGVLEKNQGRTGEGGSALR